MNMEHKALILIVDDVAQNIQVLGQVLDREGFSIMAASNGTEALKIVEKRRPDLILLDVMMPEMDGYETCSHLKSNPASASIPVIFLTAKVETEDIAKGFEFGAVDYVTKPFQAVELLARVRTHLEITQLRFSLEQKVEERTMQLQSTLSQLELTHHEIINRLGRAAEFRDNETGLHLVRMSKYTELIAKSLSFSEKELSHIVSASVMHDVGKIGIPDKILLKPGRFEPEEFEVMKTHTTIGAEILAGIDSDMIRMAETIAITHHEKFNGSGYPNGLQGEDISIYGRIVAVADVFDALTSRRPYKEPWPVERAVELIEKEKGQHFDSHVVGKFLENLPAAIEIKEKYAENEET